MVRALLMVTTLVCATTSGCGLSPGERFGRHGATAGALRVAVVDDAEELDPARAHTPSERALARQLFSALVEAAGSSVQPSLATSWDTGDGQILFHLRDARFSDGSPLGANEVAWSWRRALRPSTGTVDKDSLAVIDNGADLARGALLRISRDGVRARPAPFSVYREGPGDVVQNAEIPAGTAVRVVDTNEREPCCDAPVPLRTSAEIDAPSLGTLLVGESGVVVGVRELGHGQKMLRLRASGGAAGWARADDVTVRIAPVGLIHVVDRGGAAVSLRAGPDDEAPARAQLADDQVVELVERGPTHCLVIDGKTGRTGFIPTASIDDTVRERRWFLLESLDGTAPLGWVAEQDLALDPSLLGVRVVDDRTLAVTLAPGMDPARALSSFAHPVMRPLPPRAVEEEGRALMSAATIVTSGPFSLAEHERGAEIVLVRSPSSAEAARAKLDRATLLIVKRPTTALHLYRAGEVDALLDGALPRDLAPTLSRASDFVGGPRGGGLVAPEVHGFSPVRLELRDVVVGDP
ncbi:MAG TPA: ABC transporter substrate-binding protein [Myxococcota bacterium]